jgi:uncharacterized coiled-coil protein SlyX
MGEDELDGVLIPRIDAHVTKQVLAILASRGGERSTTPPPATAKPSQASQANSSTSSTAKTGRDDGYSFGAFFVTVSTLLKWFASTAFGKMIVMVSVFYGLLVFRWSSSGRNVQAQPPPAAVITTAPPSPEEASVEEDPPGLFSETVLAEFDQTELPWVGDTSGSLETVPVSREEFVKVTYSIQQEQNGQASYFEGLTGELAANVSKRLAAKDNQIGALQSEVHELKGTNATLVTEVDTLKTNQASQNSVLKALVEKFNTLNDTIDNVKNKVNKDTFAADLATTIQDHGTKLDGLRNDLTTIGTKVTNLADKVDRRYEDHTDVAEKVLNLGSKVNAQTTKQTTLTEELRDLRSKVTELTEGNSEHRVSDKTIEVTDERTNAQNGPQEDTSKLAERVDQLETAHVSQAKSVQGLYKQVEDHTKAQTETTKEVTLLREKLRQEVREKKEKEKLVERLSVKLTEQATHQTKLGAQLQTVFNKFADDGESVMTITEQDFRKDIIKDIRGMFEKRKGWKDIVQDPNTDWMDPTDMSTEDAFCAVWAILLEEHDDLSKQVRTLAETRMTPSDSIPPPFQQRNESSRSNGKEPVHAESSFPQTSAKKSSSNASSGLSNGLSTGPASSTDALPSTPVIGAPTVTTAPVPPPAVPSAPVSAPVAVGSTAASSSSAGPSNGVTSGHTFSFQVPPSNPVGTFKAARPSSTTAQANAGKAPIQQKEPATSTAETAVKAPIQSTAPSVFMSKGFDFPAIPTGAGNPKAESSPEKGSSGADIAPPSVSDNTGFKGALFNIQIDPMAKAKRAPPEKTEPASKPTMTVGWSASGNTFSGLTASPTSSNVSSTAAAPVVSPFRKSFLSLGGKTTASVGPNVPASVFTSSPNVTPSNGTEATSSTSSSASQETLARPSGLLTLDKVEKFVAMIGTSKVFISRAHGGKLYYMLDAPSHVIPQPSSFKASTVPTQDSHEMVIPVDYNISLLPQYQKWSPDEIRLQDKMLARLHGLEPAPTQKTTDIYKGFLDSIAKTAGIESSQANAMTQQGSQSSSTDSTVDNAKGRDMFDAAEENGSNPRPSFGSGLHQLSPRKILQPRRKKPVGTSNSSGTAASVLVAGPSLNPPTSSVQHSFTNPDTPLSKLKSISARLQTEDSDEELYGGDSIQTSSSLSNNAPNLNLSSSSAQSNTMNVGASTSKLQDDDNDSFDDVYDNEDD